MDHGSQQALYNFEPQHEFFVGIDSDGCVFNSMEVKHNDCFSVNLVKHFGLASISRQVHQAWDFVNLYSTTRGTNRFKAILLVCDFLREMPLVQNMGVAGTRTVLPTGMVRNGNQTRQSRITSRNRQRYRRETRRTQPSYGVEPRC